jgi:hypothetical protein
MNKRQELLIDEIKIAHQKQIENAFRAVTFAA